MYEYAAKPIRIIDGDTVLMDVDLGFHVHVQHSVRLTGFNAPELGTREGVAAGTRVVKWFADNASPYVLRTRKGAEFEKYGRLLGVITSEATGRTLNEDMKETRE